MLIVLFSLIGIILAGLLIVLANSPGRLPALKDEHGNVIQGSISEKVWLEIGGIKQGVFIRGESPQNPVILYLHGGPGTPMLQFISILEKMTRSKHLEKYFTVCYWDQRGAGMTYSKSTDSSSMTIAQMVKDTHGITEYLISRFGQDKIYLLGHSWGTYLGVKTIEKYPESYLAYIGIGQNTNLTESERLSYDYMLNRAKNTHDKEVIEKLEKYDPYAEGFPLIYKNGRPLDYLLVRTEILNKYGIGHIHQTELLQGMTFNGIVLRALFEFKGYTFVEKIKWFLGADFSMAHLFPVIANDNLFESSVKFEIPFYIVQGAFDYQVSQVLAEKYFDIIEASKKEYFTFAHSAHTPNMEESGRFIEVLRKIAADNPLNE